MSQTAGGQFRLTCGTIGAGKSYLNVKLAEEAKKSGIYKKVYSNIRGHSELATDVYPLPDDWRECDEDSLIIIDEVQKHEKFSKHFSSRRDAEIVDLTMIRHKRQDIWMISPDPALVNSDVRNLVNQYFFLEPNGKKTTKCYCFDRVKNNVTKTVKNTAYDEFVYTIEKKYGDLYKTTEDGKPSGRTFNLNMKLISYCMGLLIVVLIISLLGKWLFSSAKSDAEKLAQQDQKNLPTKDQTTQDKLLPKLTDEECRKGINVDKPECVEYFDNLTKNGLSVGQVNVQYDVSSPYDLDDIQEQVSKTYDIKNKPYFAGCMKANGKYVGYTQQGTIIKNISSSDCQRLIDQGDRPFNYFRETDKNAPIYTQNTNQESNKTDYLQDIQQEPYQAQNYIEPHLQAKTVNGANQSSFSF